MIQRPRVQSPTPTPATPLAASATSGAAGVYEGFRAQRRELTSQLEQLESTRRDISSQLEELPASSSERPALETRMKDVDAQIANVDKALAANASQIATAAAVPGAVVQPPPIVRNGPPEDVYIVGTIFIFVFFLPLSIAFARRIWRRSAAVVTSFPREIADRLSRMEQAVEATAVEVERIGEGQRFLTRLLTEAEGARAIEAGAAQPLERKQTKSPERLP